jgi:hypothetical protein
MRFPLALVPFLAALAHVALSACTVDLPQDPAQAPLPSFATPAPAVVVIAPQAVEPCAPPPVGGVGVVRSEGFVDVDITVGAADSVRLACDPALASAVHVEAVGEALRIWNDDAASGGGHCAVHLGLGSLRALDVSGSGDARVHGRAEGLARVAASGSGDVVIDDLDADTAHLSTSGSADIAVRHARARSLAVETSGSGDVRVAGESAIVRISASGSGDVDARSLGAADADVEASGTGDVVVHASRRVRAVASGTGDVRVAGQPRDRSAWQSGTGSIAFE